jgi:hypothetical protein
LMRQADPKAVWRGHYGTLLALAWKRGELSAAQTDRYVRHIFSAAELSGSYVEWSEDVPVVAQLQLNERAGAIADGRGFPDAGIFAVIRPIEGRIDGHAAQLSEGIHGQSASEFTIQFGGGSTGGGLGFRVAQKLMPGEHKLGLRCQIQIKRGSPAFALESEKRNAEAPLVAEYPLELTCDFDVPAPTTTKP